MCLLTLEPGIERGRQRARLLLPRPPINPLGVECQLQEFPRCHLRSPVPQCQRPDLEDSVCLGLGYGVLMNGLM
jgi:hypothetical protein